MVNAGILVKLERMKETLRAMQRVAVAFSAGADSTFVLKVAVDTLGSDHVLAITGKSDSLAHEEFEEAVRVARAFAVEHVVLETDELSNPGYVRNAPDRCYYCKSTLFECAERYLGAHKASHTLVTGTNADDLKDWRPGLKAATEHAVRSPAAEAGLTKDDIRVLSREWGLPTFDKPASPCLASRVAYGEEVTREKLHMIEEAERFLRHIGFRELRVRHHGKLARIEVPPERIAGLAAPGQRERIDAHLRKLGYAYVTLDLRGFRSGSLNEVIAFGNAQPLA
ncbi:MAG: ATP-dependent sacrificial sulfur transferase LarE [Planctomycetota bacterium]